MPQAGPASGSRSSCRSPLPYAYCSSETKLHKVAALFAGLYWRRATREGALASMIVGLVGISIISYAQYTKVIALPMHPSMYGFILSLAAMILVSLATKKPSDKVLEETKTGMFIRDGKA